MQPPLDQITLDRPPELTLECVDKPDLGGDELKNFIRYTGLDAYLWQGYMWEHYICEEEFSGWKCKFRQKSITFRDLQIASPKPFLKSKWLAGEADWADILISYQENLTEYSGLEVIID